MPYVIRIVVLLLASITIAGCGDGGYSGNFSSFLDDLKASAKNFEEADLVANAADYSVDDVRALFVNRHKPTDAFALIPKPDSSAPQIHQTLYDRAEELAAADGDLFFAAENLVKETANGLVDDADRERYTTALSRFGYQIQQVEDLVERANAAG